MSRTLISLVSDQTLPNVLFIKQFGPFDRYVFVTTRRMERKEIADNIIKASGLTRIEKMEVEAEKVFDILEKLDQLVFSRGEEIVVNITGGTKMMSLGAYAAFSRLDHEKVEIFYMPIDSPSVYQIYPDNREIPLVAQVTLDQYLSAYGVDIIEYENLNCYVSKLEESERLLKIIDKGVVPGKINNALRDDYRKPDKPFYLGKWLEIYTAFFIQNLWDIPESNIQLNMKLTRTNQEFHEETEYDVIFVRNNKIYIAECKYFSKGEFSKKKINQDWYKLAGLQLHMGLHATPFFITANAVSPYQKAYIDQIKSLFRIAGIADIRIIGNENHFSHFLNSIL